MRADSSDSIVAKFGRYCFDGCVPITETTFEAVVASRDIALSAAKLVYEGDRQLLHCADLLGTTRARITRAAIVF